MALVLIGQIQFLATLSLVDSTGAEDSWVLDFAHHLRFDDLLSLIYLFVVFQGYVKVWNTKYCVCPTCA